MTLGRPPLSPRCCRGGADASGDVKTVVLLRSHEPLAVCSSRLHALELLDAPFQIWAEGRGQAPRGGGGGEQTR